jgi:hypothetical protein
MLSSRTNASLSMSLSDAYTISNILTLWYPRVMTYIYSNTVFQYCTDDGYLRLWGRNDDISSVPHTEHEDNHFPYSTKELLTYLYDKIESK